MKRHFVPMLLSPLLLLLSFFVRRNNNKYIFGEWFGESFKDSSKYIYDAAYKEGSKTVAWITKSKDVYDYLKSEGLPVYYAYSLVGIYHQITSKYFICSVSSRDFNCFTCGFGARVIQLGHGLPIKHQSDSLSYFERFRKSIRFLTIDKYYKVASESVEFDKICHEQNRVSKESILRLPTARSDIYKSSPSAAELARFSKANMLDKNNINVIYLPTHRNEGEGVSVILDVIRDLENLAEKLNKKHPFKIKFHAKLHFYDASSIETLDYQHVNLLSHDVNLNFLFRVSDMFIGDYSGVCYDYIYYQKPMIAYVPDFSHYLSYERKLYIQLDDIYGEVCFDFQSLINVVEGFTSVYPDNELMYLPKFKRPLSLDIDFSGVCWEAIKGC